MRAGVATTHGRRLRGRARARGCAPLRIALTLVALLVVPSAAWAQTSAQIFERAREAYLRGNFDEVVTLLEPLVGGVVPSIHDVLLIRESRKYLAAAYVLTGQESRARQQFEDLLRAEGEAIENFRMDPAAFPAEVLRVYRSVRDPLVERLRSERETAAQRAATRDEERRAAIVELVEMAQVAEVTIPHDPALAWVPFGAGQFQNGDEGLGWFFLVTETFTLASAALLTAWSIAYEASVMPRALDVGALRALQIADWVSLGAFGALAIAGVVEAHIHFVPSHVVRRTRDIPPEIQDVIRLELTLGPGGVGLRGTF